ncbi:unnamed protein product [Polarella glacialis]|uniref:Uncharacterized protein n=1 Tax=Polarella glacialis TaxID=89957 RepID=A0A813G3H8_POLGL|nr:unnamed protein product [Polarella glacialis]
MQQDVADCILLEGRRFTLRVYLVVVEDECTPARCCYLSSNGLVYRALEGSEVTNCSQSALKLRGSAQAAGAPPSPDLRWLEAQLAALPSELGGGPLAVEVLWRRLRRLARLLATTAEVALNEPMGELANSSVLAPLGIPKILGLDVILSRCSPSGSPGPWPWLLEVNRFPGLGLRSPSDACVKLPVVRDAWNLADTREAAGCWPVKLGCLEALPVTGRRRRS